MKQAFALFDFFSVSIYEPNTVKYRQMCDMRISADYVHYVPPITGAITIDRDGITIDSTKITIDMI